MGQFGWALKAQPSLIFFKKIKGIMISSEQAILIMKGELDNFYPKHITQGGRQYAVRCPFCGDSVKHSTSTHFYIKTSIDVNTGYALFSYQCKLCDKKSIIMSIKTCETLGIKSDKLLEYLNYVGKIVGKGVKNVKNQYIRRKLDFTMLRDANVKRKMDYLISRLGHCEVTQNPSKFKIILDLRSFFVVNKLKPNFADYKDVIALLRVCHEKGIGTVSFDNTHIEFRDYTGSLDTRYKHYNIYPHTSKKSEDSSGIYIIPCTLNIMRPNIHVILSEGVYDILRIYSDIYKDCKVPGMIFCSVHNSHGYLPTLKRLLKLGILPKTISIYSDSDVNISFYINNIRPYFPNCEIIVYYNTEYKDFGEINKPCKISARTI